MLGGAGAGAGSLSNVSGAGSMSLLVTTQCKSISGRGSPVEGDASGGMVVAVEVV